MKSINRVQLMGNVSWDPKLFHTDEGKAVCSFGVATNRNWTIDTGEKREETEFHRIVAFGKLAEICNQYLRKGRRVLVDGRIHSHTWTNNEGVQLTETEIYIDEMAILDSKLPAGTPTEAAEHAEEPVQPVINQQATQQEAA